MSMILIACHPAQAIEPAAAKQMLADAWSVDQYTVWEIEWATMPIGGALVVETWQSGSRYRYEILESPAPALIGQTLVFDGQQAWQYNRLDPPHAFTSAPATLSPVTDAFAVIDRLITTNPQSATHEKTQANFISTTKIEAMYPNGDRLTLWRNVETGLPVRIQFEVDGQQATLNARDGDPLINPPEKLFSIGNWVKNS